VPTLRKGFDFIQELKNALGMRDRYIRRIVIDAAHNSAVLVYVEEFFDARASVEVIRMLGEEGIEREQRPNHVIVMDDHGRPRTEPAA
jgi:hypothetical protein